GDGSAWPEPSEKCRAARTLPTRNRSRNRRRGPELPDERGRGIDDRLGSCRLRDGRLDVEQIADPLERLDPARLAGLGAELAPDARDPDAQVLQVIAVLRAPDLG